MSEAGIPLFWTSLMKFFGFPICSPLTQTISLQKLQKIGTGKGIPHELWAGTAYWAV